MNIADLLKSKADSNQLVLTEFESKELLEEIGIPVPPQKLTVGKDETITAAEKIGFPVVLKLMAEDIKQTHIVIDVPVLLHTLSAGLAHPIG